MSEKLYPVNNFHFYLKSALNKLIFYGIMAFLQLIKNGGS